MHEDVSTSVRDLCERECARRFDVIRHVSVRIQERRLRLLSLPIPVARGSFGAIPPSRHGNTQRLNFVFCCR